MVTREAGGLERLRGVQCIPSGTESVVRYVLLSMDADEETGVYLNRCGPSWQILGR